jgi:dTDP-glucose 4,6-dehydratase
MQAELGWSPAHRFETGIEATLTWYLNNLIWCDRVRSGAYREYLATQYG